MLLKHGSITLVLIACLLGAATPALAGPLLPEDDKAIVSLVYENDVFSNSDKEYTNGVRLSWLSSEDKTPDWAVWTANHLLPLSHDGHKRIGLSIGQNIYTPKDLSQSSVIPGDRPYAGWLYGSVGMISDTGKQLDNVMLTVGVVGPYSYAEQTQKFVHHVISSPQPQGWNNQLKTEPGIVLTVERKWRALYEFSPFGMRADITPHAGFNLGNINTDASLGVTFRLGFDLPADYGPPRIRPSLPGSDFFVPTQELAGYFFVGAEGRAVARNIFLDGNSFRNSPSVDKELFIGTLQTGVAVTYENARISYSHVLVSKEFKEQISPSPFGVITFSYRF